MMADKPEAGCLLGLMSFPSSLIQVFTVSWHRVIKNIARLSATMGCDIGSVERRDVVLRVRAMLVEWFTIWQLM
jgi:hypothetical protein